MPDRVEVQDLTCPAGTPAAMPLEVRLDNVVACQVLRVTIRIPAGHAGLTGLALGYGHNPILPRTPGRFISGDDEVIVYDLSNYPPGPQWQAFLTNLDTQSHAWEVRFEVDELTAIQADTITTPLTPQQIYAGSGELIGAG